VVRRDRLEAYPTLPNASSRWGARVRGRGGKNALFYSSHQALDSNPPSSSNLQNISMPTTADGQGD